MVGGTQGQKNVTPQKHTSLFLHVKWMIFCGVDFRGDMNKERGLCRYLCQSCGGIIDIKGGTAFIYSL